MVFNHFSFSNDPSDVLTHVFLYVPPTMTTVALGLLIIPAQHW